MGGHGNIFLWENASVLEQAYIGTGTQLALDETSVTCYGGAEGNGVRENFLTEYDNARIVLTTRGGLLEELTVLEKEEDNDCVS